MFDALLSGPITITTITPLWNSHLLYLYSFSFSFLCSATMPELITPFPCNFWRRFNHRSRQRSLTSYQLEICRHSKNGSGRLRSLTQSKYCHSVPQSFQWYFRKHPRNNPKCDEKIQYILLPGFLKTSCLMPHDDRRRRHYVRHKARKIAQMSDNAYLWFEWNRERRWIISRAQKIEC